MRSLRDLKPFVQFKKRERHPWRSVNFSKVAGFSLKPARFLNCTNGTKSRKAPQIANGFDTISHLLFLQKAQSKMLVGFLNLPFLMNRLQHKNCCIF